jgi:hypothetical protein
VTQPLHTIQRHHRKEVSRDRYISRHRRSRPPDYSRAIGLTSCRDLSLSRLIQRGAQIPQCPSRSKEMEKKSLRRAAGNKQRSDHERWPKEPANPNCVTPFSKTFQLARQIRIRPRPLLTITTPLNIQARRAPEGLQRVRRRELEANIFSVVHARNINPPEYRQFRAVFALCEHWWYRRFESISRRHAGL